MESLARVEVSVDPGWVGVGISTNNSRGVGLVDALVRAQNDVFDQLDDDLPDGFKVGWRVMLADGSEWEWNPQVDVPAVAKRLVFEVWVP